MFAKSNTNKITPETPVQYLKGVGPKLASLFANKQIYTIRDLLYFFPRTYEDRSRYQTIAEAAEGESATLSLTVRSVRRIPLRRGYGKASKSILKILITILDFILKWTMVSI